MSLAAATDLDLVEVLSAEPCAFRWTSRACPGSVERRYFAEAAGCYLLVCLACADRAIRAARGDVLAAEFAARRA